MKGQRRLLIIEKPFWKFKRQTARMWQSAAAVWRAVFRFLNRDAPSFTILLAYSIGGAYALSRWPAANDWLGLTRPADIVLTAIFLLWALMFLVWIHERVQEWLLRWGPALLAAPLWTGPFAASYALLAALTTVLLAVSLLILPLGALAMACGMLYSLWRRRHGITVRCSRGDCETARSRFRDIEVCYVCDCASRYSYLVPSYYGLRYHHCTCGRKLPAQRSMRLKLDNQGRTIEETMAKVCPKGHPWGLKGGSLPTHFITLVGGSSTGKTCYMRMAVEELLNGAKTGLSLKAQFESASDRQAHQDDVDILAKGDLPSPTQVGAPSAAVLSFKGDPRGPARLYLYDAAGEIYSHLQEFEFFEDLTGIMVLIDPLSLPKLREQAATQHAAEWNDSRVSGTPVEVVFASLRRNVSRFIRYGPGGRTDVPVAVVISKANVKAVDERVGPGVVQKEAAGRPLSSEQLRALESEICRRSLVEWGMANEIRALENQFRCVAYFACSPLGRTPDNSGRPYRADRVLPPLIWLLNREASTTSKSSKKIATGG